ncbi:MAG: ParB/RepB/Spo0J family partition protein [bacterium]|nr:ParB/RepB/Spo0J family partition protein [bacterium]
MSKTRGLGRGLAELIKPASSGSDGVQEIAVALIDPNPLQPRVEFDPEELAELAASIMAQGLLQPVTVRRAANGRFELIAGERRLRATRDLGQTTIHAIVREVDDRQLLELALVENIMRSDLNEIEVAEGLRELQGRHGYSAQQLADVIGRSRPAVSNALRLLELPQRVRDLVRSGTLSAGHARAVLSFPEKEREAIADEAVRKGWSVRTLESVARQHPWRKKSSSGAVPALKGKEQRPEAAATETLRRAEHQLMEHLGTKVQIDAGANGKPGSVSIHFHGSEDLERLLSFLLRGSSPV